MNNKKEVKINIVNLDRFSHVEKDFNCDACINRKACTDMTTCPMIADIAYEVLRTTYCIDKSKLHINTGTYDHDFRRALEVVNTAIDARCHKR